MEENKTSQQVKLKFPLETDVRIILDQTLSPEEGKERIASACKEHELPFTWGMEKASSGGNYISYTINVLLVSREQMLSLFETLGKIPGSKKIL